jgi:hypothetical protein
MKTARFMPFLLLPFLLNALKVWANPFEALPNELVYEILNQNISLGDLALQISFVDRRFNLSADDLIKNKLEESYQDIRQLHPLQSKDDFKKLIQELYGMTRKLDQISLRSKEEIQNVLEYKEALIVLLLHKIEDRNLKILKQLLLEKQRETSFNADKFYLASFFANYSLHLSAAWKAAEISTEKRDRWGIYWMAGRIVGAPNDLCVWNSKKRAALATDWDDTRKIAWGSTWDAAIAAYRWIAWNAAWRAANSSYIYEDLKRLDSDSTEITKINYDIYELVSFHRLEQKGYDSFITTFEAAYNELDETVNMSEIRNLLTSRLNQGEISKNLFIQKLNTFQARAEELILGEY